MEIALEVLKWVALVFLAGVIGQLGKSLTVKFLERRRRGRARGSPIHEDGAPLIERSDGTSLSRITPARSGDESQPAAEDSKERQKARKKALKAEVKRAKKEAGKRDGSR